MNIINPQYIREYLAKKFGEKGRLSANSLEFIMPSPYVDNDWKKHFSINLDTGLWQCFKTGKSGNFITLFAFLEEVSYRRAYNKVILASFFKEGVEELSIKTEEVAEEELNLIPVNIESHDSEDAVVQKAWTFLFGRNLFNTKKEEKAPYYVCKTGRYENRLIIPFVENEKLFYFQARALGDRKPKYLNPFSSMGVKPSEILYPFDEKKEYLLVCEGPLDAISLQLQGVNATCTMGCSVSETQMQMLQEFQGKLIVGYDNDEPGKRGLLKFDALRRRKLINTIGVCGIPQGHKDWNEAHISGKNLKNWVENESIPYNYETKILEDINLI